MNPNDQEIEAKFLVMNLPALAKQLEWLGAERIGERVREQNLRFDTPSGMLSAERRVLRLRSDRQAVLTYKGPAQAGQDVAVRTEIEVVVSDFAAARRLLEALGYQVRVMYEKYRTTYRWGELEVVLDELPYGAFLEIEGPAAGVIKEAADRLGLEWSARSQASYLALFERLKTARGLQAENLSFAELEGVKVLPEDLGLRPADTRW